MCAYAKLLPSYWTLCNSMDCSPPGFSVHGILQARILEWVTMPLLRDLPHPEIEPMSLTIYPTRVLNASYFASSKGHHSFFKK